MPKSKTEMITARILETEAEKLEAYKLRYQVYVEEMGREDKYVDSETKTIIEPLDFPAVVNSESHIIGAFDGPTLVGTTRVTALDYGTALYEEYRNNYGLDILYDLLGGGLSLGTKMIIRKKNRHSSALMKIFELAMTIGLTKNKKATIIDCNPHMIELYEWIGYRRYTDDFKHPVYGMVTPLYLDIWDLAYLKNINSPLAETLENYLAPHTT